MNLPDRVEESPVGLEHIALANMSRKICRRDLHEVGAGLILAGESQPSQGLDGRPGGIYRDQYGSSRRGGPCGGFRRPRASEAEGDDRCKKRKALQAHLLCAELNSIMRGEATPCDFLNPANPVSEGTQRQSA